MTETTEFQLAESRAVTLNSNGEAVVSNLGPTRPGETWRITKFSVYTDSTCVFRIYRGPVSDLNQIDITTRGDGDTSDTEVLLIPGEFVSFSWTRGTVGAIGTIRLEGRRTVPGRRGY